MNFVFLFNNKISRSPEKNVILKFSDYCKGLSARCVLISARVYVTFIFILLYFPGPHLCHGYGNGSGDDNEKEHDDNDDDDGGNNSRCVLRSIIKKTFPI